MECREILEKLSEYVEGELDPRLCEELEKHTKDCHPCLLFVNSFKKTLTLYKCACEDHMPKEVHLRLHDFLKKNCRG